MDANHPFRIETNGWERIENILRVDGEMPSVGLLSLDEGIVENGDSKTLDEKTLYLGPVEEISGDYLVLPPPLSKTISDGSETIMVPDERNEFGFFTGNVDGYPVEIKYDEDIPDSEEWHAHSGFEAYSPQNGGISLGFAQDPEFDNISVQNVEEGDVLLVAPYVQHKVVERKNDPDLAVVRYDEEFKPVTKYDSEGDTVYSWEEDPPEYTFEPGEPDKTVKRV